MDGHVAWITVLRNLVLVALAAYLVASLRQLGDAAVTNRGIRDMHAPTVDGENVLACGWAFEAPRRSHPVSSGPVPTFSVIVPAYEASDFIAGAVRSVLEQTVPPLEVIVCDDGSTDDLAGALEFAAGVVVLRQEHTGQPQRGTRRWLRHRVSSLRCSTPTTAFTPSGSRLWERSPPHAQISTSSAAISCSRCAEPCGPVPSDDTVRRSKNQRTAILERCFCPVPAIRRSRLLASVGSMSRLERSGPTGSACPLDSRRLHGRRA